MRLIRVNYLKLLSVNSFFIAILLVLAFELWLVTIASTRVTILTPEDFLGTLDKVPLSFWVALIFIFLGLIFSYQAGKRKLYFVGIGLLILALFATFSFIEPHGRHGMSYSVTGISKAIMTDVYYSPEYNIPWLSIPYMAFKGFPALVTICLEIIEIDIEQMVKYFSTILVFIIASIVYIIYQNTEKTEIAILGLLFFVVCTRWHLYMVPEGVVYILVLAFLAVLARSAKDTRDCRERFVSSILLIIILFTVTITHILGAIFLCLVLSINALMSAVIKARSSWNLVLMSFCIVMGWLIYVATSFFEAALPAVVASFESFNRLFHDVTAGVTTQHMSTVRMITDLTSLLSLTILLVFALIGIIGLLIRREYHRYALLIATFLSSGFMTLIPYGGDINIVRTAFFITIAAPFLGCTFLHKKKTITYVLLIVFFVVHPIAYSGSSTVTVIPTSELEATKFFVNVSQKTDNVFYQSGRGLLWYQDPERAFLYQQFSLWYPPVREFNINWNFKYLLHGMRDHNGLFYWMETDPVLEEVSRHQEIFNRIYDNNSFWIFIKTNIKDKYNNSWRV
ncbi:hypothetical protein MHLNE_11060 [Moorella humiferrea]|uniref:hypothetical protein n=1 Tax=Neomoorella humiferrea TaxID=676965 RepID=UPI0030D289E8